MLHASRSFWVSLFLFLFRYDTNSGGEREIQRTMLELLNQLDGFDARGDIKVCPTYNVLHSNLSIWRFFYLLNPCCVISQVIMATNRIDSLDPGIRWILQMLLACFIIFSVLYLI